MTRNVEHEDRRGVAKNQLNFDDEIWNDFKENLEQAIVAEFANTETEK